MYAGRPGISPVLATLIALNQVRKGQRILDVGFGRGTELLLLAKWGFRDLEGVDPDAKSVATARGRATRMRLGKRVTFRRLGAEKLTTTFGPQAFDVVLHTLIANNLTKEQDAHFREIRDVLKPKGLLIVQERMTRRDENRRPDGVDPLAELDKYFRLTPSVSTHLPEYKATPSSLGYARVALWFGYRRKG